MEKYEVSCPEELRSTFDIILGAGIVFSGIATILYMNNIKGANKGHVVLGLLFVVIGLVGILYSRKWRIEVSEKQLKIHYFLKGVRTISIEEIEKAVVGKKSEIILYIKGKKLVTLDPLLINKYKLSEQLKRQGIPFNKNY